MKSSVLLILACIVSLVAILLVTGCTSLPSGGTANIAPVTTAATSGTPAAPTCGFTTCHGSDLACGSNAPAFCTQEFQQGDTCRKYAQCTIGSDGSCTLVTAPQFASCKACVQQCAIKAGDDAIAASDCEEKC